MFQNVILSSSNKSLEILSYKEKGLWTMDGATGNVPLKVSVTTEKQLSLVRNPSSDSLIN